MATTKSVNATATDATPFDVSEARVSGGYRKGFLDIKAAGIQSAADVIICDSIPVDCTLSSVKFASDDLGTTGTVDIGFYKKNVDGTYTAVDDNAIADAIDVNTAAVAQTEYRYSAKGIETIQQKAWELAGLSARPAYDLLYFGLTFDVATTAAGDVTLDVDYLI